LHALPEVLLCGPLLHLCRPWSGVYLSEEYLSSVAAAEAITAQLLATYAAGGVVPLVETAVKRDAELEHVVQLRQTGNLCSQNSSCV
jgi:hypothetical protein